MNVFVFILFFVVFEFVKGDEDDVVLVNEAKENKKKKKDNVDDNNNGVGVLKINRSVTGSGFHRYLHSHVGILSPFLVSKVEKGEHCVVVLVEDLLNTVYVDFDQVFELNRFNAQDVPKVYGLGFTGGIEIEKPAEVSKHHKIFTIAEDDVTIDKNGKKSLECTMNLPIHLRYQKPSDEPYSHAIVKQPSQVFVGCNSNKLLNDVKATSDTLKELQRLYKDLSWYEVTKGEFGGTITLDVPTGLLAHETIVQYGTAAITLGGAMFLSYLSLYTFFFPGGDHDDDHTNKKKQ